MEWYGAVILVWLSMVAAVPEASGDPVLIVSIDGLRPDALSRGRTPNLMRLIDEGVYTLCASSLSPTATIPNHVSMLTGLTPQVHGITDVSSTDEWAPESIHDIARAHGFRVASYVTKGKLSPPLGRADTNDRFFLLDRATPQVLERFYEDVESADGPFDLTFIHLHDPDTAGHLNGWMSADYLAAVARSDADLGSILSSYETAGILQRTLVIVTSDHGGKDRHHLEIAPENRQIPWIAVGPHTRPGEEIRHAVGTHDVAPTALTALGIDVPPAWQGWVVAEAFGGNAAVFVRGDTDGDGALGLGDAIGVLTFLFLGHRLDCDRAADVDANGTPEVSDAIWTLAHLFLGDPPPPAPFPDCGQDSSPSALTCEVACEREL